MGDNNFKGYSKGDNFYCIKDIVYSETNLINNLNFEEDYVYVNPLVIESKKLLILINEDENQIEILKRKNDYFKSLNVISNTLLEDDESDNGGISFIGETLIDFLKSVNCEKINEIDCINGLLIQNGIRPIKFF